MKTFNSIGSKGQVIATFKVKSLNRAYFPVSKEKKAAKDIISNTSYFSLDKEKIHIKVLHINYSLTIEEQPFKYIEDLFLSLGYAGGLYSEYYSNELIFDVSQDKGAALLKSLLPYYDSCGDYRVKGIKTTSKFKTFPFAQGTIIEENKKILFRKGDLKQVINYYKSI